MQTAHNQDSTLVGSTLAVSLELAGKTWKLGLQSDSRERPAMHNVSEEHPSARFGHLCDHIEATKHKWRLAEPVRVAVMYEAGQDGFWIYRALTEAGYEAYVVDPASIPVERQARRAKTDRLDVLRLLSCLRGWLRGECDRMHPVRVPTPEAEALRHQARERGQLQKEIGQHRDRIRKLLRTVGCWTDVDSAFAKRLGQGELRGHNNIPLSDELRQRLQRECDRMELAQRQFKELEASLPAQLPEQVRDGMKRLQQLRGVGDVGACRLMLELFWRRFDNRRQVGSCVGLVPQPYDSGQSRIDQGISKQGNRRVRALLIEMSWMWLRHQPNSDLTRWYAQHAGSSKRSRRIAIVAVARRLVIALWRYLADGVLPKGGELKPALLRKRLA